MNKKSEADYLVVGLGNPGEDYVHTLHNVGFDTIDLLAEDYRANYWKDEGGAKTAHVSVHEKSIILAKPMSFMNTSGGPVSEIMKKYKMASEQLVVIHDDLDLEPGVFRAKFGGGSGGHNGIKSIQSKLSTREFAHFKVGIGHPPAGRDVVSWVLARPKKDVAVLLDEGMQTCREAVDLFLKCEDFARVQGQFN